LRGAQPAQALHPAKSDGPYIFDAHPPNGAYRMRPGRDLCGYLFGYLFVTDSARGAAT